MCDKCEAYVENFNKTVLIAVISSLHMENWKRLPIAECVVHDFIEKGEVRSVRTILRVMKSY